MKIKNKVGALDRKVNRLADQLAEKKAAAMMRAAGSLSLWQRITMGLRLVLRAEPWR